MSIFGYQDTLGTISGELLCIQFTKKEKFPSFNYCRNSRICSLILQIHDS